MPRDDRARWGQSTHTRAAVSFHTDEVGGFEAAEPIESHPDFGRILSVSTEKSMGAASGTFTVVVKTPQQRASAPRSWKRLWRDPEQVWVWIKFIVDGEVVDGMFGQIDSISEGTSRSGLGARSETFTITGRDFGKVFETTELFTNFYAAEAQIQGIMSQARLIRAGLENITGTPAHFIRFLVETWLSNNGIGEAQWTLPSSLGGNAFYEMLNLTTIQRMEDRLTNGELHNPNIIAIDQQGSKLWDSMQNLCHGLLNEMWVDLAPPPPLTPLPAAAFPTASIARVVNRPSPRAARPPLSGLVPSLYLRERPFPTRSDDNRHTNHAKWDSIRTRRLTPGDVASRQLARGGAAHRFNYWQLDATGLGSQDYGNVNLLQRGIEGVEPGFPGNNPIFNGQSMQLHGVRRYFQSTRFLPLRSTNSESEVWVRVAGRWLKKLHDWFSVAPFEVSGTITTSRLMPEIRIGERVKESRAEGTMVYYCEGVSNEWQYPNAGRTSLTLTRGEYEDENLLDYVYETFTSPSVLSARERCFVPPGQDTAELIATGQNRSQELIDALARGCGFAAVRGDDSGLVLNDGSQGEVTGAGDQIRREPRTLTAERDGTVPPRVDPDAPAIQDPGMSPTVDDTDPAIADGALPPPGATPEESGDPALSRTGLEQGEPIVTDEEFAVLSSTSEDPILGIEGSP